MLPLSTTVTWAEAAEERLCLLSADMQNRRILDNLAAKLDLKLNPRIVSNSFLSLCAHVRHGGWAAIVPHTFKHVFGEAPDLMVQDLVEPLHSQAIGPRSLQPRSALADGERPALLDARFSFSARLVATLSAKRLAAGPARGRWHATRREREAA